MPAITIFGKHAGKYADTSMTWVKWWELGYLGWPGDVEQKLGRYSPWACRSVGWTHWLVPLLFCLLYFQEKVFVYQYCTQFAWFHFQKISCCTWHSFIYRYMLGLTDFLLGPVENSLPCHSGVQGSSSAQGWDESAGPAVLLPWY